jgi:hypothetical protein
MGFKRKILFIKDFETRLTDFLLVNLEQTDLN